MIGIKNIAVAIPEKYRDNLEQAEKFEEKESFVRDRLGPLKLPVLDEGQDTSDLATEAVLNLLKKSDVIAEDIQCLIVCTQNPDGCGLPHTAAIVQDKAGLPKTLAAFDVSLGCSGYVYGLNVIKGMMAASGYEHGILVTCDPYSKILDLEDRNTAMLFGDAATATLIGPDPIFDIGKSKYGTDGSGAINLINNDGVLFMNGRQVFNFAATRVPAQIKELLEEENISADDVDLFILHQGSKYILDTIQKRLRIPAEKVPFRMQETGNTISSSVPLILIEFLEDNSKNKVLLSGFGVGLSWGSILLTRRS